jgi:hypothetical protein
MIGALIRQRSWLAGFCWSGAICLKVFPAFLVLYVIWRRDWRCLAGCALGLALGFMLIPTALWGPERALWYHQRFAEVVLWPGLGVGNDQSRAKELTEVTATDSQSLVAVIHNTMYPDRSTRPHHASASVRLAALLISGALVGLTFWAARLRQRNSIVELFAFGQLVIVMLVLCPVCHLSYFCLTLPLIMAIVHMVWISERLGEAPPQTTTTGQRAFQPAARPQALTWLFVLSGIAQTLPHIPGLEIHRDIGLGMYAGLTIWLVGWNFLRQLGNPRTALEQQSPLMTSPTAGQLSSPEGRRFSTTRPAPAA